MMAAPRLALSENGCPYGSMPVLVPSPQGGQVVQCVPGGSETVDQTTASPPSPGLSTYEWLAVTHNALAISDAEGVHGMASGHDTASAATAQALERCAAAGGNVCEIVAGGQNSCLTAVRGPAPEARWWWNLGHMSDREFVEGKALEACRQGANGQTCRVVQTVCERDRPHPGGVSTRPQPGVTYGGVRTPLSASPSGPGDAHHCGGGRRPVLLRVSDGPGSNLMQMHCLPDPRDANVRAQNYADAAPIPRRFEWFDDRFGASAADSDGDAAALAVNSPTQAHADLQAVAACQAEGGARCEVVQRVQNACIALARGPGKFRYGLWGFSQESTEREVVEECNKRAGGGTCTLMVSACSFGAFSGLRETPQPEVSYRYTEPPK